MDNKNNNPPSPQTGEKELMNLIERVFCLGYLQQERWKEDEFCSTVAGGDLENKWGLAKDFLYQNKFLPFISGQLQPPAAQSDQEAAEKWADESIDPWRSSQETFLAGCTHVRSQQPVDAVAFGIWLSKNYIAAVEDGYIGLKDKHHHTTADLYALFTARHPTPKPGSHD